MYVRRFGTLKKIIGQAGLLGAGLLMGPLLTATPANAATSLKPPTSATNGQTWVEVSTPAQLEYIDQHPSTYLGANIELMNNITLPAPTTGANENWIPFGNTYNSPYSGSFNGQGYRISGLVINDATDESVGFFGYTTGTIENLSLNGTMTSTLADAKLAGLVGWQITGTITNVSVTDTVTSPTNTEVGPLPPVGGLAGQANGIITHSHADATVLGGYGSADGGLVGSLVGGTVQDCYATGSVLGGDMSMNGGLVGTMNAAIPSTGHVATIVSSVQGSYARVNVTGPEHTVNGGLVGVLGVGPGQPQGDSITNSYAVGSVFGNDRGYIDSDGGLVGTQDPGTTISDSYATGHVYGGVDDVNGGLIGEQWLVPNATTTTIADFFDSTTSTLSAGIGLLGSGSSGITGEPTLTLQQKSTYVGAGWNFSTIWGINSAVNAGFPYLLWQEPSGGTPTGSPPSTFTPPTLTLTPLSIGGLSTPVISNLGENTLTAIEYGTTAGFAEERAAIAAGVSATGEGIDSGYLVALLDGSGVGLQQHISAVQQGQFAALYQKLGIIPTWTDNTVNINQGVKALLQAGASALAIENYLVQLDGFSWTAAQAQAGAGFPIQSGA